VHVVADPLLQDRASWVREGAAVYFAAARAFGLEEARALVSRLRR
jgi:hypothetical protein